MDFGRQVGVENQPNISQGREQMMKKEGHFGVTQTANKPIEKVHPGEAEA